MEQTVGLVIGSLVGLLIAGVIGLFIGVVAKVLMPGPDPGGWFATILLGIGGSWVGGFLSSLLGITGTVPLLVSAVAGAMILLGIFRLLKKAR